MSNNGWLSPKSCQNHNPDQGHGSCQKTEPYEKKECCCKNDMKKALKLLLEPTIHPAILNDKFAFIGKKFLVGTSLELIPYPGGFALISNDNIDTPSATLNYINPCQCDTLDISADGYFYPIPVDPADDDAPLEYFIPSPVCKVSLCNLDAVAFDYNHTAVDDFESALVKLLDKNYLSCFSKPSNCFNGDCCCGDTIFHDLYKTHSFDNNCVSISAGWLSAYKAKVLGKVGNILVLANSLPDKYRIYFVCLESVELYNSL